MWQTLKALYNMLVYPYEAAREKYLLACRALATAQSDVAYHLAILVTLDNELGKISPETQWWYYAYLRDEIHARRQELAKSQITLERVKQRHTIAATKWEKYNAQYQAQRLQEEESLRPKNQGPWNDAIQVQEPPPHPKINDAWYDPVHGKSYIFDGTRWVLQEEGPF